MPHHVYHTQALVLRGRGRADADKMLELFTEGWGVIAVHARGIRREASRLRYVLQPLSWVEASIVRGENGWRLTTANPLSETVPYRLSDKRKLAKVTSVVPRFFPRDIPAPQALRELRAFTMALLAEPERSRDWEVFSLMRILASLGYWGLRDTEEYLKPETYASCGEFPEDLRKRCVAEINRILRTVDA